MTTLPRTSPHAWLNIAFVALVASCSSEREEAPPVLDRVFVEHLELRLAEGSAPRPTNILYRRLNPGPEAGWEVTVKNPRDLVSFPMVAEGRHEMNFNVVGEAEIVIPGPFDPRAFDVLGLEVEAGSRRRIEVHFRRGERETFARVHKSSRADGREIMNFELRPATAKWENIGSIHILTGDSRRPLRIIGASLVASPPGATLPAPEIGADYIHSRGEKRLGVGVLPKRAVETEFEVSQQGGKLRFSYTVPRTVAKPKLDTQVLLRLQSESQKVEIHRFQIDPLRPMHWNTVSVPLDSFKGSRVTAQWKVTGQVQPAYALAEVSLVRAGDTPIRVLMITSDTHRFDHTGVAGRGVEVRTPTIDALAKHGIFFEDCFTSTNVTNPSHVALMTGTSPRDTGIRVNNAVLSDAAPTLAEAFRRGGFATYSSVSIKHLSPHSSGLGQGFDRTASPDEVRNREASSTIEHVVTWMEESRDLSVFIWLHLFDAHTPYETEEPFNRMYYPEPEKAFDPDAQFPNEVPQPVLEFLFPDLRDIEYPSAQYKSEISYLDKSLNRLLSMPVMQDAIIGFTADHGESLGNHNIFFSHDGLYPDSIHVPMIISFPDGPREQRSSTPVEQIDLGRTLLDLAGLAGSDFPGRNIVSIMDLAPDEADPRFSVAAHHRSAAVTEDGWHLMLWLSEYSGQLSLDPPEFHAVLLFNLREDIGCEHDLLDQEFERAKRMRQQLVEWLLDARHLGWDKEMITDSETIRELQALGYTAGTQQSSKDKYTPLFHERCSCDWCKRFR